MSVLSIAARFRLPSGRITGARIAYAAMAPTPLRAKAAERALEGRSLDAAGIAPALAVAADGTSPVDDAIASAWWRREIFPVHLRRLLLGAAKHEAPMKTPIQFRLNGEEVATFVEGGANLLDMLREGGRRFVGQRRLLAGYLRNLHGADRRRAARFLHDAWRRRAPDKSIETTAGLAPRPRSASAAKRVHGALRRPVRLLHAGNADGGEGAARPQSQSDPRGRRRRHLRQYLPLHRLRANHRSGTRCRARRRRRRA